MFLTKQAGLTTEERDLIAAGYDDGVLLVCVATCSLAAGINLLVPLTGFNDSLTVPGLQEE